MKPSLLFICIAVLAASQGAFAGKVNRCKDSSGRTYMTERPCGDPATEHNHHQSTGVAATEVEAKEIFGARKEINRPPASPELIDSRGIPGADDPSPGAPKAQD
jgi:hypothetical protein